MSNCAFCGAELPDNARFCSNCGKTPQVFQASPAQQSPQVAQKEAQVANIRVSPLQNMPPPAQSSFERGEQQPVVLSDMSGPGVPPREQPPSGNAPINQGTPLQENGLKWLTRTSPKRLVIGLIIIIIVAISLGITAAFVRAHLTGNANSTTTPGCTNQSNATCTTAQKNNAPATHSVRSANLRISGAVNGPLTAVSISSCGRAGLPYDVLVSGKVGSTRYNLVFRITAYHGAGTYGVGQLFATFTQQPVSATTTWATTGTQPTTATVSSNTSSGTMNITLNGAINTISITGSWSCG